VQHIKHFPVHVAGSLGSRAIFEQHMTYVCVIQTLLLKQT